MLLDFVIGGAVALMLLGYLGYALGPSGTVLSEECDLMLDVVMLVIGIGFFALAVGYAFACERL